MKVEIDDHLETDRIISDLMSRDAPAGSASLPKASKYKFLPDQSIDNGPGYVGQSIIAAFVAIGQLFVIDTQLVK